jgi:hypothetical protein
MSETRTNIVRAWCGRESRAFQIKFRMESPDAWKAISTFPDSSAAGSTPATSRGSSAAPVPLSEMSGSFDFPECAYCTSHDFFKCGCGALVCQGKSEMKFERLHFYCPQCRRWGPLEGCFTSLQGEEMTTNKSLPARAQGSMLTGEGVTALPPSNSPRQVTGDSRKMLPGDIGAPQTHLPRRADLRLSMSMALTVSALPRWSPVPK